MCFICKKKKKLGHYAKNFPNKSNKAIKMINSLGLDEKDDIESLYLEQINDDEETIFALQVHQAKSLKQDQTQILFPYFQC